MRTAHLERRRERTTDLGDHALQDLRYIRQTMERASSLTTFPGWGQVGIGVSALIAAAVSARVARLDRWLAVWLVEAAVAVAIGSASMAIKARRLGQPLLTEPWRQFALSFSLPILAGVALTSVFIRDHWAAPIPGTWMLMYGVAIAVGGAFSVASVRAMGYAFMALGVATLLAPPAWHAALLAVGFGGLHIVFGIRVARAHGG